MKTLYMVRHAKSSWEHDVIDHKRPLNKRGQRDAVLVSNYVAKECKPPQQIITSDAERAFATATFFKKSFHIIENNFKTNPNLYDFSGHKVMDLIKQLDDRYDIVMIVGHNHAFTSVANMLGNKYLDNVPTCGFVKIEFNDNTWSKISNGNTLQTVFPRDLK
ncbi:MAG: histidine phosphatase family protein [Flavobacteriaceae bacterium]